MLLIHWTVALLCTICSAGLLVTPPRSPHVLHESRRHLPEGWTPLRRAAPNAQLPLRIGITQSNISKIEALLLDVSHPDSPNYGNHLTAAEVATIFRPSQESIDTVTHWLSENGVAGSRVHLDRSGAWLEANVTVAEAELLMLTEYFVYRHEETGIEHVACDMSYHLPEYVAAHVDLIVPTLHFDVKTTKRSLDLRSDPARNIGQPGFGSSFPQSSGPIKTLFNQLGNCDEQITPACIRALYNFVYSPVAVEKNTIAIVEYTPQAYVGSDLDMFFGNFSQSQVGERPSLVGIDGGFVQGNQTGFNSNGESNLDLQYAMSLVGREQKVTLYQVGDDVEGASFDNLLDALDGSFCTFEGGDDPSEDGIYPDPFGGYQGPENCGTVKPAFVISTSYSMNEANLTPAYSARQCAEYAKLGLMGVTVLHSSGDRGVAGRNNICLEPNGTQSASGEIFSPSFPGTCPYVTSVGATQVNPGAKVTDKESACEQVIFSGGGFSNHFTVPEYQKSAVQEYLSKFPPPYPSGTFNTSGRAYPDIAANGANYVVAVDGQFSLVYGTSASTPVVASILSAINDARLAIGKKSIGFINPVLYSSAFKGRFNDITNGTNPGCGTVGFAAQPGWDPVTGNGTPDFGKLKEQWLQLP